MRTTYVWRPLALSALAMGLLLVGAPAVHAAQDSEAPQGYKQKDDRDRRHYDRKDGHMDGRRDNNRGEQGEKMGKPRYDRDKGDRRAPRGDEMGRQRDDRRPPHDGRMNGQDRRPPHDGQMNGQDRRPPRDVQQRGPQNGQRPAPRPDGNDGDVRN